MINMENLEWYIRRELNKAGRIHFCRGTHCYYHRFGNLLIAEFGDFSVKMCNYINKSTIPLDCEEQEEISNLLSKLIEPYPFDNDIEEVGGIE